MIVMTDGRANETPNSQCYSDPSRQWTNGDGSAGTNAQDCVIYYAHEARNNSVIVYTITLGGSADFELMQAVADMTGGVHRNADRPEKLPAIFEELYELMFLKLVE
jgi:Mg-chelatase subunit ChlD